MVRVIRLLGDTQPVPRWPESLGTPRLAASLELKRTGLLCGRAGNDDFDLEGSAWRRIISGSIGDSHHLRPPLRNAGDVTRVDAVVEKASVYESRGLIVL